MKIHHSVPLSRFHLQDTTTNQGACSLQKLVIPALLLHLGPDMSEDHSVCTVWVLKVYLAKTEDKRKDKELLFISYKESHKEDLH